MSRKNKKTKVEQLDIFIEIVEKLKIFFQESSIAVTRSAKEDAVNPPPKEAKIKTFPEVNKIKFSCSKILASITKYVKGLLDTTLTDYQQLESKLKEKQQENPISTLQDEKEKHIEMLDEDYKERDESLSKEEANLTGELKIAKLNLQDKTKHALLWSCLLAFTLASAISGSEVSYTAKGFELTGLSYYERLFVAIGLGLSTIFVGVAVVEVLRSNLKKIWKILGTATSFLLICAVFLVVGKIRVDLLKKEMATGVEFSDLSAFDFMLINLIFFVAIVLIHWLLWPTKDKFRENSEYNKAKKQVDKDKSEIKANQKKRFDLPKELLKEKKEVDKKFESLIAEHKKELAELVQEKTQSQTTFNNIYGRLVELYDEVNFFHKETIGLYIATMNKYRNDGVFMTIDESLEDLPNPFRNFKYLDGDNPDSLGLEEKEHSHINLDFDV